MIEIGWTYLPKKFGGTIAPLPPIPTALHMYVRSRAMVKLSKREPVWISVSNSEKWSIYFSGFLYFQNLAHQFQNYEFVWIFGAIWSLFHDGFFFGLEQIFAITLNCRWWFNKCFNVAIFSSVVKKLTQFSYIFNSFLDYIVHHHMRW